jgi:hypothetical protein
VRGVNAATCGVLSAVFPLVLLTVAIERRSVSINIRRTTWFRWIASIGVGACAIGLPMTVGGVAADGLEGLWGWTCWAAAAISFAVLAVVAMMIIVTSEVEEDHTLVE